MLLSEEKSLCEIRQKILVSRDKREAREHRAINPERRYLVRHYRLDGDIIRNQSCCDYLLLNDSLKKAYFIELKGRNLSDAVAQLENGSALCKKELKGYEYYFRVVASKVRTHEVHKNSFRKLQEKYGSRLKYASEYMEERLG